MAKVEETPVESQEVKLNVIFRQSPNHFGYGNFIGQEGYVDPAATSIIAKLDSMGKEIEGKNGVETEEVNTLDYFLKKGIVEKI